MRGESLTQTVGIHSNDQEKPVESDLQKNQNETRGIVCGQGERTSRMPHNRQKKPLQQTSSVATQPANTGLQASTIAAPMQTISSQGQSPAKQVARSSTQVQPASRSSAYQVHQPQSAEPTTKTCKQQDKTGESASK
jgi:hypothetical protein